MVASLKARHLSKAGKARGISEDVLKLMTSCQTSANEFLRHFWSAILPARQGDFSAIAKATPVQKASRAAKMIGYLAKTDDRVALVLKEAAMAGQDLDRIRFVRGDGFATLKLNTRLCLLISIGYATDIECCTSRNGVLRIAYYLTGNANFQSDIASLPIYTLSILFSLSKQNTQIYCPPSFV